MNTIRKPFGTRTKRPKTHLYIVIIGNPVDGLQFIGPFPDASAAAEFSNTGPHINADWWIASVEKPEAWGQS